MLLYILVNFRIYDLRNIENYFFDIVIFTPMKVLKFFFFLRKKLMLLDIWNISFKKIVRKCSKILDSAFTKNFKNLGYFFHPEKIDDENEIVRQASKMWKKEKNFNASDISPFFVSRTYFSRNRLFLNETIFAITDNE